MLEMIKKQWFVILIALIFSSFAVYYIYDTNKGKLPGKSVDGKDVVATIGKENITADKMFDDLNDSTGGSVASVYFTRYVADQSVKTTKDLEKKAKQTADSYLEQAEQQYGTLAQDMIDESLAQLNYDSLEDYFLIQAKLEKLVNDYYDKHLDELFKPLYEEKNGRVLAHILIKMEDANNPTEAELAKVEAVDKALADGKSFYEVAKEYSEDSGSASDGGRLGYSDEDTSYVPEFLSTAQSLTKGEVSDWVKVTSTNYSGWHKILCVDDTYKGIINNDSAKSGIYDAIAQANSNIQNEILWKTGKKLNMTFDDKKLKKALMNTLGVTE